MVAEARRAGLAAEAMRRKAIVFAEVFGMGVVMERRVTTAGRGVGGEEWLDGGGDE